VAPSWLYARLCHAFLVSSVICRQLSKADKGRLDNLFAKFSGKGFVASHSPLSRVVHGITAVLT